MGKQIHKRLGKDFVVEILAGFNEGRISEVQACELLQIGRTRLYEVRKSYLRATLREEPFELYRRSEGHLRGFPEEVAEFLHRELKYIRDKAKVYRGKFNFAFLAEEVHRQLGVKVERNSVRRFALRHGYYHMRPEEKGKVYTRFEKVGPGALFQHDDSEHCWMPTVGGKQHLILTQDDMSRKVVGWDLVMRQDAWAHLQVARQTVETYGCPLAYYCDNHSLFRFVGYHSRHYRSRTKPDEGKTQFKRALKMLGIDLIYTKKGNAQAKGKVEKRFDFLQRRVPMQFEKYRVKTPEQGKPIVEELVGYYNEDRVHQETGEIPAKRWDRAIKEDKGRLRPVPCEADLEMIFSLHDKRVVRKDGTILVNGKFWNVGRFREQKVAVCFIPGKKFLVVRGGQRLCEYEIG